MEWVLKRKLVVPREHVEQHLNDHRAWARRQATKLLAQLDEQAMSGVPEDHRQRDWVERFVRGGQGTVPWEFAAWTGRGLVVARGAPRTRVRVCVG